MMLDRTRLGRFSLIGLLLVMALSASFPLSVTAQSATCGTALPPRLAIGQYGRVTEGSPNNVRGQASKTSDLVGKIPGGETFEVVDGPKCVEGLNWWLVKTSDFQGWTVEADSKDYWVNPYMPAFSTTTKDEVTHVQFDNLSFDFTSALADKVTYQFYIANWGTESPLPDNTCINLDDSSSKSYFNHFCIIAVTDMAYYVDSLKQIVRAKSELGHPNGLNDIPTPFNGAVQLMHAQPNYIDTDTVAGISYVAAYAQDDFPIYGDSLLYNFSGYTKDGEYILFFQYNVSTDLIPSTTDDDLMATVRRNPRRYYKSIADQLNTGKAADFTPNLDTLNAIISSIVIK